MGRPRKNGKRRNGRLVRLKADDRYPSARNRVARFGVTVAQSINPLGGYLAGVLYLRGKLRTPHMGHFYSFLQIAPRGELRAIEYRDRVQGACRVDPARVSSRYYELMHEVPAHDLNALHALTDDRLVVPIPRLRRALERVPISAQGDSFALMCSRYRKLRRRKANKNKELSRS